MFTIRESDSEEENDLNNSKSKYFIAGSILKTNQSCSSESAQTSTTNEPLISCEATVPTTSLSSSAKSLTEPNTSLKGNQQTKDKLKTKEMNVENRFTASVNRKPIISGNTIQVNPNQSGNKLLKHFRYSSYEFNEGISPAHYLMFQSCCAIFLSLKYHVIYPNYIYDKLTELGNAYQLQVLLVLVDHIEFQTSLKELTKLAIRTNCTLMLCWSYEEAANCLENYKLYAERPPDIIMGKLNPNNASQSAYQCLVEALASVKSINRTDAVSMISMFDTFENIIKAEEDELTICPGMASLKAQRLRQLFNRPFIRKE